MRVEVFVKEKEQPVRIEAFRVETISAQWIVEELTKKGFVEQLVLKEAFVDFPTSPLIKELLKKGRKVNHWRLIKKETEDVIVEIIEPINERQIDPLIQIIAIDPQKGEETADEIKEIVNGWLFDNLVKEITIREEAFKDILRVAGIMEEDHSKIIEEFKNILLREMPIFMRTLVGKIIGEIEEQDF